MIETHGSEPNQYLLLDDDALIGQCEVDTYRDRGPGGQKRNKTDSAVRLRHRPTGLSVTAVEDRSQHVNKRRALRRLREAIALGVRTQVDLERYECSETLTSCITASREIRVADKNPRYYPVIAELLDVIVAAGMRISTAAEHVNVSTAHLVKMIRSDRKLWTRVNDLRGQAGMKPLR